MTSDVKEIKTEELDKALSGIDGLDSSDKAVFRVDTDTFLFNKEEYKLIEDHKEAFDLEMMEERFTDYLLKYDYIVGDIAYEKLRLRGFYDDHRKGVPIDMKISNLEDYLVEYCNFGCQYFVFERSEKKKADPESYFKRNKKTNKNKKRNSRNRRNNQNKRNNQQNRNNQRNQNNQKNKKQKDFQVVKKQETSVNQATNNKQTKPVATNKKFKIRKKKDE